MGSNYVIKHVSSGLVLEPDGEGVILRRPSNSFLQLWKIEMTSQHTNILLNHDLWRALESLEDGRVKLKAKNGKKSQEWLINSDGTIENLENGLVLDVQRGEYPLGGRIVCEEKRGRNQHFALEVFNLEDHEYNKLIFY